MQSIVKDFLMYLSESERNLETQRCKLEKSFCFSNQSGYFKYLDKNCKNYVDIKDISTFLSLYKIKHTEAHLKQIIKKYDSNKDHCWNADEFNAFSKPKSKKTLTFNYVPNSNNYTDTFETVSDYEKELAYLFQMEISILNHIAIKVKGLKNIPNNTGRLIDAKTVYNFILSKACSNRIDVNCLNFFLCGEDYNSMVYYSEIILDRYGNNQREITLKQMEDFFTYDSRFINEEDIVYKRTKGYYKTNPVDYSEALYYNVYQNNKKKYQDLGCVALSGSSITFK